MNDFESRVRTLLNEQIDTQVGPRRSPPPFAASSALQRAQRRWFGRDRAPWVLPLLAAACVAAVVGATLGATDVLADGDRGRPASTIHPPAPPVLSIVAGNGRQGVPVPGPAIDSPLNAPVRVTVDRSGNLYILDDINPVVEKVTSDGRLSIVAGSGETGAPRPGRATDSPLGSQDSVAVDGSGNVYIADWQNSVVEKVTPDGTLSIVAGTGEKGAPRPGPALDSPLSPTGLALDGSGNLYLADSGNHVVEKVSPDGALSIVAGSGADGAPSPGPATESPLRPYKVDVDGGGNLYIASMIGPAEKGVVAKVTSDGTLSIIAGGGNGSTAAVAPGPATSRSLVPMDLAVDRGGDLYIASAIGQAEKGVVAKVTSDGTLSIVAGDGKGGSPRPGPPTDSPMFPKGVAIDDHGNLYVADDSHPVVAKVSGVSATPQPPSTPSASSTSAGPLMSQTPSNSTSPYTAPTTPVARQLSRTHVVQAFGATLVLPDGWTLIATGQSGSGDVLGPGDCIGKAHDSRLGCPITIYRLRPQADRSFPIDVDAMNLSVANLPTFCGGGKAEKSWDHGDRTFGGRPADWRSWRWSCPASGHTMRFDQYTVATTPGFLLEVNQRMAYNSFDAALSSIVDTIVQDSALPAQTAPLRLFDRGILRSVHRGSDGVTIVLDRTVHQSGCDFADRNHRTYTYVVPTDVFDAGARVGLIQGDPIQVTTDGSKVVSLGREPGC